MFVVKGVAAFCPTQRHGITPQFGLEDVEHMAALGGAEIGRHPGNLSKCFQALCIIIGQAEALLQLQGFTRQNKKPQARIKRQSRNNPP